jgi:hypothetical protein
MCCSTSTSLYEPVYFSIDGRLTGTSSDGDDQSTLQTCLIDLSTTDYIGNESHAATLTSFDLIIDGVKQGNSWFAAGLLEGQIGPGRYQFVGSTQFHDDHDGLATMSASGFTRLTLTALNAAATPEPASFAVWSLLGLAFSTASHRRRSRSLTPTNHTTG